MLLGLYIAIIVSRCIICFKMIIWSLLCAYGLLISCVNGSMSLNAILTMAISVMLISLLSWMRNVVAGVYYLY